MITSTTYNKMISQTENPLPNEGLPLASLLINGGCDPAIAVVRLTSEKLASDIENANSKLITGRAFL